MDWIVISQDSHVDVLTHVISESGYLKIKIIFKEVIKFKMISLE